MERQIPMEIKEVGGATVKTVLKLLGKVVAMIVSFEAILIGSIILSGQGDLFIPAGQLTGEMVIKGFFTIGSVYQALLVSAILIGLWYLVRRWHWSWKLTFEPWLLLVGLLQFFVALSLIPALYISQNLLLAITLELILLGMGTIGVGIFVLVRRRYYDRIKNWL